MKVSPDMSSRCRSSHTSSLSLNPHCGLNRPPSYPHWQPPSPTSIGPDPVTLRSNSPRAQNTFMNPHARAALSALNKKPILKPLGCCAFANVESLYPNFQMLADTSNSLRLYCTGRHRTRHRSLPSTTQASAARHRSSQSPPLRN